LRDTVDEPDPGGGVRIRNGDMAGWSAAVANEKATKQQVPRAA
jgi:hypothetical protein